MKPSYSESLAEAHGWSMREIERGLSNLSVDIAERIATGLGVTLGRSKPGESRAASDLLETPRPAILTTRSSLPYHYKSQDTLTR